MYPSLGAPRLGVLFKEGEDYCGLLAEGLAAFCLLRPPRFPLIADALHVVLFWNFLIALLDCPCQGMLAFSMLEIMRAVAFPADLRVPFVFSVVGNLFEAVGTLVYACVLVKISFAEAGNVGH